jgi:predicted DNA-binding protein (MmcQ/YjbR family)
VPRKNASDAVLRELREFGLRYPGAHTRSPWPGHLDLAVKGKTFAFMSVEGEPFSISCKLPHSGAVALTLPHTQPTPYGLGKNGWVSAQFPAGRVPPVVLLKAWIDESYRALAPKTLLKQLPPETEAPAEPAAKSGTRRRAGRARSGARTRRRP